jgi:hypothetical protein
LIAEFKILGVSVPIKAEPIIFQTHLKIDTMTDVSPEVLPANQPDQNQTTEPDFSTSDGPAIGTTQGKRKFGLYYLFLFCGIIQIKFEREQEINGVNNGYGMDFEREQEINGVNNGYGMDFEREQEINGVNNNYGMDLEREPEINGVNSDYGMDLEREPDLNGVNNEDIPSIEQTKIGRRRVETSGK